jgi:hypothetical protein
MPASLKTRTPAVSRQPQLVEVNDLTGGVNLRVSPTLLEADQAVTLRNYTLEEPGALKVRLGHARFGSANFGAGRAQGGRRIYLSSHTFTLVAHNSTVYQISDLGAASTTVSGFSTNQIYFPYDRDIVAVLDGSTNRTKKSTDGSSWTNFGIDSPLAGPSVSSATAGAVSSGEYAIAYSYKNRALSYESNISSGSTITLTASTGAFTVTAAASTDVQADAIVWYAKDITAGETVFRKVSSGSSLTIKITDTNWTANDEAPTDHNVLMNGVYGVIWKNRWWIVDSQQSNRIHFSQLFLPQAFPALFYIDIPFERGDSITSVVPLGDVLYVFGQTKAYAIIGQTSLDFEVRPSAGVISGALGFRATTVIEQGVVHASAEGVHIFDGATDKLLTHNIDPAWRDFISNTAGSELAKTPMVYEFRRKCLRVGVAREYPYGTPGEWELNLDRTRQGGQEAWAHTNRNIGGYIQLDGNEQTAGLRGELVSWSDTTGFLFKESTGNTANSSNMIAVYEGPTLSLGLNAARILDLHVQYEPHSGSLTQESLVDTVSQGARTLSIGAQIAQWGSMIWGTFRWGGAGRRKAYTELPLSALGRNVAQRFTYSGTQQFRLFSYAFTIRPESKPRRFTE